MRPFFPEQSGAVVVTLRHQGLGEPFTFRSAMTELSELLRQYCLLFSMHPSIQPQTNGLANRFEVEHATQTFL